MERLCHLIDRAGKCSQFVGTSDLQTRIEFTFANGFGGLDNR
jgi:hypothetical protein